MKRIILNLAVAIVAICGVAASCVQSVFADANNGNNKVETSILSCPYSNDADENGKCVYWILNVALTVLTFGVGAAGVLGIAISGVQYLTARDNEAQVQKAKSRILQVVIGLAAYAVLWTALNWLIPGGIFNGGP